MKRKKCELIAASEYDHIPAVAYDNDGHKYHKDHRGHYLKLSRKTCYMCNKPSLFVGIFTYRRHKRVERFCSEHAQEFTNGPLPPIPEKEKIESKPRKPIII
jgi:hypothetical protein